MISNKELSLKSSVAWTQRQEMAKKIVLKVVTGKEVGWEGVLGERRAAVAWSRVSELKGHEKDIPNFMLD